MTEFTAKRKEEVVKMRRHDPGDCFHGEGKVSGTEIFFKTVNWLLIFSMVLLGVPPIPASAPWPLRVAGERLASLEALADQVKGVQRGTVSLIKDVASQEASLTNAVEMDKSFWVVGGGVATGKAEQDLMASRHVDQTTLLVSRGSGKLGAGDAKWQMVDFVEGVTVQKGASSLGSGIATKVVTLITPVTKGKSFPLLTRLAGAPGTIVDNVTVNMALTGEVAGEWTTVTIKRGSGTDNCLVEWQVVTFDNAVVQDGITTIDGTTTSPETADTGTVSTVGVTAVDPTKSFIVLSSRPPGAGSLSEYYVQGVVTNGTTLTFTRSSATNSAEVSWYLVEMVDGTSVQRGVNSVPGSLVLSTASDPNLTTVVADDESFSLVSASGGAAASDVEIMHELATDAGFTVTTLTLSNNSGGTASVAWQVVTMPPVTVTYPNGTESLSVGDTGEYITWNYSRQVIDVKIEYSTNAFADELQVTEIVASTPAAGGSYNWNPGGNGIPDEIGSNLKVRITDVTVGAPAARADVSDAPFTIKGSINLTDPDGDELWFLSDTNRRIEWSYNGAFAPTTVSLYYSINSDAGPWLPITGGAAGGSNVPIDPGATGSTGYCEWNPIDNLKT